MINTETRSVARKELYQSRLHAGICVTCGKAAPVFGYVDCEQCKIAKSYYQRRTKKAKALRAWDSLVDNNWVTTLEAVSLTKLDRKTIYSLVKTGKLRVRGKWHRQYLFHLCDIQELTRQRLVLHCNRCDYTYRRRCRIVNRCPKCSSKNVTTYTKVRVM